MCTEFIKDRIQKGTRIRCLSMTNDPDPIPSGTDGTVKFVDGIGTIHVDWDNGRSLGLVPGEDRFQLLTKSK